MGSAEEVTPLSFRFSYQSGRQIRPLEHPRSSARVACVVVFIPVVDRLRAVSDRRGDRQADRLARLPIPL